MAKVIFKPYEQNQMMLLPPSLEEMIKANHPVRIVNQIIEKINIKPLLRLYKGGGSSSYNAKMMLKLLVYSYLKNIYSSRKIEEMTKENIHMMWISGMNSPDHHTINRFRTEKLKKVLEEIFTQIVMLLVEEGQLSIKEIYVDGTKLEANANKYSFVWGKSIKKNKKRITEQIKELWQYSQESAAEEEESQTERIISVSHKGNQLRQRAREKLGSDIGIRCIKKRPVKVEPIFGNIKQNKKFKRFLLRGIEKVKIEVGLIAIAHNLMKFSLAIA